MCENDNKQYQSVVPVKKDAYVSALKDFVNMTIKDPSFFKLPPEQQKKVAMEHIQKQKEILGD
ncbi:hypothetical protein NDS46_31405 (plasmid) [Paenibacillus thiaminolyticus]|uniref:hypothetical protein n=1 Tax=Paenibacillus thiaminolyticus TaxID=49283 RepID=UPI00232C8BB5|nr:hypothetical protein [Paenibacillus thiaminolyticus]WCF11466.1 hypothetical protein NDS46_31405 [Paenibacillus thiaminolyticus]